MVRGVLIGVGGAGGGEFWGLGGWGFWGSRAVGWGSYPQLNSTGASTEPSSERIDNSENDVSFPHPCLRTSFEAGT